VPFISREQEKDDMPTDAQIESEIVAKGKTAARVTPADLQANIASEHYFTAADAIDGTASPAAYEFYNPDTGHAIVDYSEHTYIGHLSREKGYVPLPLVKKSIIAPASLSLLTFCVLVLRNGFTVTGESACASPENFDAEIGRKIARQNAEQKIWPLMGYALKQELHNAAS
jgi:hypothetical protein